MYLLDTDVLIWVLRGKKEIIDKVLNLKDKSALSVSVISVAEIYKNIFPAELTATEDYLEQHIIFEVDWKIAKIAGLYWQQYAKRLKNLSLMDCLIAGTANINNATLVSLNIKHFPMRDIQILNPLE
ncbi:MAG: type II toxin-antitoxin system VapC family toxin [Candidatus Levybacteria bacterium]|nr:type II toxin-antitoxin system VapC family toxin [Candidatus Levybacteria bacterium]